MPIAGDKVRIRRDRRFAIAQRIVREFDRAEVPVPDALVIAWPDLPGLRDADRVHAWGRLACGTCAVGLEA